MVNSLPPNKEDITSKLEEVLDCYVGEKLAQEYEFLKTIEAELHGRFAKEGSQYLDILIVDTVNRTEDIKHTIENLKNLKKLYEQEKELAVEQGKQSKDDLGICLEGHKKNIAESMLKKVDKIILDYREVLFQYDFTIVSLKSTMELLYNL